MPRVVWGIVALHLAIVLCQTAVFPNFRAPDERQHADLIVMVEQGKAWPWPGPGELDVSKGSRAGGFTTSTRAPERMHLPDRAVPERDDRASYVDAGGAETGPSFNQLIQHPPLYYLTGAAFLSAIPGWEDVPFDRVYLLLRWWNALLTAALPLLLWATARRLRLPRPLPVAAALVPLAIPELTRNESAINNDNLLVVLMAAVTWLVARVLTGDTSRRTALWIGVLTTLALLTKGFALLLPAWIGLVYLVAARRYDRRAASTSLVIAWVTSAPGALWWAHNKLTYGSIQPDGRTSEPTEVVARYGWSDGGALWLHNLVERVGTLFFMQDQSGRRLHDVSWKAAWLAIALVVLAVLVTLALRTLARSTTLLLLVPVVGLFLIVASGTWANFVTERNLYSGMQGRYLYGGLVGLGVVAVAAAARLRDRVRWCVPLAVLVVAVGLQLLYLRSVLELFWAPRSASGVSALDIGVRAIYHWYALPPAVLLFVMASTVTAGLAVAYSLARPGKRRPPSASAPVIAARAPSDQEVGIPLHAAR
ncbi:DUF2142 domain-containing protein [Cryptosporangium arvum]|uniref:DUF2142 domain-containing protein n=1 Tax=Cryptosporangium arvum TaxID=80871 RepID=UPI0004B38D93|nr:DUF2142 domain-containing protein [Cryptosporangium arvum]